MFVKTVFGLVCAAVFVGAIVGELIRAGGDQPKQPADNGAGKP